MSMQKNHGKDASPSSEDNQDPQPKKSASGRPWADELDPIDDDEIELIGDLGNEEDDPDGWMSERASYWRDLPAPPRPTREAWLRHQIIQMFNFLRTVVGLGEPLEPDARVPESEWIRLYEEAFGSTVDGASDGKTDSDADAEPRLKCETCPLWIIASPRPNCPSPIPIPISRITTTV